jgi:UDP-N-acetylglucosamine 4,6-dehydratase
MQQDIKEEKILIFGGSGSLGKAAISQWIKNNQIVNVSRDEEKLWALRRLINNTNLTQIVGDISVQHDVEEAILSTNPTIICIFACLKHIDLCEKFTKKSIDNNVIGIINVNNTLMRYKTTVHTVLFVSTDKACLPITTYGCSKALAEFYLQGVPDNNVKWVGVRYGNVLNSSGSIIPYLQGAKNDPAPYTLTHTDMTRFIMTLDESVSLIEYAIIHGKHNEIIIPPLTSMRIRDLIKLYADKYNKEIVIIGLRCREKIHEDLLSPSEATMTYRVDNYYHIGKTPINAVKAVEPFDSSKNLVTIDELKEYLIKKQLF